MKDFKLKAFIVSTLRRASYRHPARNESLKRAKIDRNQYKCNCCRGVFPRKEVQIDHIIPVVDPIVGFVSWDEYINRMFCPVEGYQILCITCHDNKTDEEKLLKKKYRSSVKSK